MQRWRKTDVALPFPSDHVYSETALCRQITETATTNGAAHQFIQRVMVRPTSGYERPAYRLVELRVVGYTDTLVEARALAESAATREP